MRLTSILEAVGHTPEVRLSRIFPNDEVWAKVEKGNPAGSIKDRIALGMIEDAEKRGLLKPGATIIEPTSGNTGVALAFVAAVKGYRMILVMPASMSVERRRLMSAYGAHYVLTDPKKGMQGTLEKAKELNAKIPGSWVPQQFENPANPETHARTTALEILEDFPEGLDYVVTGFGSGGHITGVARTLKSRWPNLKVFGVEPAASPLVSEGHAGPHPLQGIGANFVPKNLDVSLLDGIITVEGPEAFQWARKLATKEGIFAGITSGAALAAVAKKLPEFGKGKRILTFTYDTGERYLSVPNFVSEEGELKEYEA